MNREIIAAAILLGLVGAISCSVDELPALAHIDVDDVDEEIRPKLEMLGEYIERHGDLDSNKTLKMFDDAQKQIHLLRYGAHPKTGNSSLTKDLNIDQIRQLEDITVPMNGLIHYTKSACARDNLDKFFGIIKVFFKDDLAKFAAEEPLDHQPNLHAFLRDQGRRILIDQLPDAIEYNEAYGHAEESLLRVIAHDLEPEYGMKPLYNEDDLIKKAQSMDLVKDKFDAQSMLDNIEDFRGRSEGEPSQRLMQLLDDICDNYSFRHWKRVQIYNWSRILTPKTIPLSRNFRRQVEFMRVCLPVLNKKTRSLVAKNIKKNMGSFGKRLVGKIVKSVA